jgi:hypothetical protein
MDFKNIVLTGLTFEDGALNTSGIEEDAYFIPLSYFATLQTPVANPANALAAITISGSHVLKPGKAPIPIATMFDKSGMDSALAGEKFSKISMPNAKFFQPQPTAENAANFAIMTNVRGIVLIKRSVGGSFIQIGNKGLYASVKEGSVKFGDGPTGTPGIEFVIEAPSVMPYYVYAGELPVAA